MHGFLERVRRFHVLRVRKEKIGVQVERELVGILAGVERTLGLSVPDRLGEQLDPGRLRPMAVSLTRPGRV